jgi:hypothetical protein
MWRAPRVEEQRSIMKSIRLELASGVINRLQDCSPATGCGQRTVEVMMLCTGRNESEQGRAGIQGDLGRRLQLWAGGYQPPVPAFHGSGSQGLGTGREAGAVTMGTGGGAERGGPAPCGRRGMVLPSQPSRLPVTLQSRFKETTDQGLLLTSNRFRQLALEHFSERKMK